MSTPSPPTGPPPTGPPPAGSTGPGGADASGPSTDVAVGATTDPASHGAAPVEHAVPAGSSPRGSNGHGLGRQHARPGRRFPNPAFSEPAAPHAAELTEPRSGVIRNALIGAAAVVGLFLHGLASDLLAGILGGAGYPSWLSGLVNTVAGVVVVLLVVVWAVGRSLERRRRLDLALDRDLVAPGPPIRPVWLRPRTPWERPDAESRRPSTPEPPAALPALVGRAAEVDSAVRTVLGHRVVAVVGPPGSGTSAVVEQVVDRLLDEGHAVAQRTAPFDVRGWATTPDDAPTIAGQLLPTFGLAEPASGDPTTMAAAASRLRARLSEETGSVLVLDNVTDDDQIRWLTTSWTGTTDEPDARAGGPTADASAERTGNAQGVGARTDAHTPGPLLVIAYSADETFTTTSRVTSTGPARTKEPALTKEWVVPLGPLDPREVEQLWTTLLAAPVSATDTDSGTRTRTEPEDPPWYLTDQPLVDLLRTACAGMPAAVHDLARELARPGTRLTPERIGAGLGRSGEDVPARERVWRLILHATTHPADGEPGATAGGLSTRALRLARALAELPVAELTVEAIEAVRAGIDQLPVPRPAREKPAPPEPASMSPRTGNSDGGDTAHQDDEPARDPIQGLCDAGLLCQSPVGRYRMPREIRSAVKETLRPTDLPHPRDSTDVHDPHSAATRSLLHRYADLADRWSVLLDSTAHAASAARWFRAEEPFLRALLCGDLLGPEPRVAPTSAPAETGEPTDEAEAATSAQTELLADTIDDIGRIADALDAWYARQHQVFGAEEVHAAVQELAARARRHELERLARTRVAAARRCAGVLPEPDDRNPPRLRHPARPALRRGRFASALWARRHHERALVHLARAEQTARASDPDLALATEELQRAWALLPKRDVAGEVTTLLTMAVAYLRQGSPDRATDRLDLAETKAQDSDDASGLAHAAELRGVASWMHGRSTVAVAQWQRAMAHYSDLDDRQGQARCLQHLGSAVVVAPELAGLLVDEWEADADQDAGNGSGGGRPLDTLVAIRHGHAWLDRSQLMRSGHPGSHAAKTYLGRAGEWIDGARKPATTSSRPRSRPADVPPDTLPVRGRRTDEPSSVESLLTATRRWFRTRFL